MKIFSVLFFVFGLWSTAVEAKELLCKMSTIKAVKAEVERLPITDKNMHCSASCILTLKCYPDDVLAIGIGKEILDILTPGDCDINDIRADLKGIRLVTSGTSRDSEDCYARCLSYYPN
ncbi:MAG: hypothetical protein ACJ76H_00870 [Bacteriovoracaceae bacterium]